MFIAFNSNLIDTAMYSAHATAEAAVQHLIDSLYGDHTDVIWASEDGKSIVIADHARLDFTVEVFASAGEAVADLVNLDEETMPRMLRLLATAIENGVSRDL